MSRLFFVFARARRAVSLAKSYAFSFARVWRAVFFGAKVLLWADGKKHLRLMSLWRQRQLSAKFLRFFERNRICWTECKILTFRSHSPLKSAEKRSIAVNLRKNGALPFNFHALTFSTSNCVMYEDRKKSFPIHYTLCQQIHSCPECLWPTV